MFVRHPRRMVLARINCQHAVGTRLGKATLKEMAKCCASVTLKAEPFDTDNPDLQGLKTGFYNGRLGFVEQSPGSDVMRRDLKAGVPEVSEPIYQQAPCRYRALMIRMAAWLREEARQYGAGFYDS